MLHPTLAGHLPLQDMIQQTITSAREKIAAASEEEAKKTDKPFPPKKDEKKDEKEKKSSVLDFHDADEMDKLASALEEMGDDLIKEADSIENGGEAKQGGEQLPTQSPTGGKQNYKRDAAKHQVPTSTGMMAPKDNPGAATAVPTDDTRAPGGNGAKYPAKGVLKTAATLSETEKRVEKKGRTLGARIGAPTGALAGAILGAKKAGIKGGIAGTVAGTVGGAYAGRTVAGSGGRMVGTMKGPSEKEKKSEVEKVAILADIVGYSVGRDAGRSQKERGEKHTFGGKQALSLLVPGGVGYQVGRYSAHKDDGIKKGKTKKSAADFILDKVAEFHGGGETLDDKKLPVPMPPGRSLIQNKDQIKNVTKRDAKAPRKAELAQVLTEPAMTSSTDSKVQDNLRNAAKGGVKIAEATKEALLKIASDPSDPRHEALKKAIANRKATKESDEKKEGKKEEKNS